MISDPLAKADWSLIPDHLRYSIKAYVQEGRIPGNFLVGCLANDLDMVFDYAPAGIDLTTMLRFIKRYLPKRCYGTPERLAQWEEMGGWNRWTPLFEYGEPIGRD